MPSPVLWRLLFPGMRFIEWPPLTRLCAILHNLDVGDRVIRGRLELLSTAARVISERSLMVKIEEELHSSPLFVASSPPPVLLSPDSRGGGRIRNFASGALRKAAADSRCPSLRSRELLVNLISTLNQCFPDYEFSSTLTPAMFCQEPSLEAVQADINQKLAGVERVLPGFLYQLWDAVKSAVTLEECSLYSHVASGSEDPTPLISLFVLPHSGPQIPTVSLTSFFYFFLDQSTSRLLFFACASTCKMAARSWRGGLDTAPGALTEEDDADEVDIGDVYVAEASLTAEEPTEEADSLSDLELPSSACAFA